MQYLLLFLEGIIAFISPCLLPLLPIYIFYFAAGEANKRKTLTNSLGFISGFTLVFILLGAFAGTIGSLLLNYAIAVNIVTGVIVIIFGLNFMGVLKIGFLNATYQRKTKESDRELNFFSSALFGITFSITWTPCAGAFLASALMMASQQGGTLVGILMLFLFSLGLGIPFVVSAVLIDQLKGAFDFIKRNYRIINIASGALLIAIGVLMATGLLGRVISMFDAFTIF